MNINYDKLKKVIEVYAEPWWAGEVESKWPWRKGGGEIHVQERVLKKAAPYLTEDSLRKDPKDSVMSALKTHFNLLSQFEFMFAKTFIDQVYGDELRDRVLDLLYGPEDLGARLRKFLKWAKLEPVPDKKIKKGMSATVASYLLAMSNPRQYPFCKPVAYDRAVTELLGKDAVRRDSVERILHCQEVYSAVLDFLEREHGLVDGNLLDVHSMLFCCQEKDKDGISGWDKVGKPPVGPEPPIPPQTYNPFFDLLFERHNLVFYGPPGTGKTRDALLLGRWWKNTYGPETVSQITFHPSYSYEDFIEGFRPTEDGSGFELRSGIFKKLCQKAAAAPDKKFLIIIDEINRGDVARILGELITLLEGDKRGELHQAMLQQSGEAFFVPENLYVLGTMNTADKSISLMDLAIRRRFLFHYFPPDPDVLDEGRDFLDEVENIRLSRLLIGLNQRLMDVGVDRDRVLGHSFFMISRKTADPLLTLKNRFRYEIVPLVEEYCYADRSLMARVLGDLVEVNGAVNADVLEDNERFLSVLQVLSDIE
ncbi:MAG: AAA family ATPase [Deltaproteobacteria bacterium]|nr:AAA family ATPase [Deltaproteobacteria bacterium]